jgi:hypothetical protein
MILGYIMAGPGAGLFLALSILTVPALICGFGIYATKDYKYCEQGRALSTTNINT